MNDGRVTSENPAEEIENPEEVLADKDGIEILSNGVSVLKEIYERIPEDQIDFSTVTLNAGRVADFIELLLAYAAVYEGVNTDDLEKMVEIESSIGTYKTSSKLTH